MTINEALDDYEKSAQEYVDAKNLYRNTKSEMFLKIIEESEKKPSDSVISAKLDANPKLQLLRANRDRCEIQAYSCRLAAEAVVKMCNE